MDAYGDLFVDNRIFYMIILYTIYLSSMPHSEPRGFWYFLNEIMMGKEKSLNKTCFFTSENRINQIINSLSSITRDISTEIKQDVIQKSKININCGGDNTQMNKDH